MNNPSETYRYTVDPASDSTSARILRLVGGGKTVLDVGAGPGSISRPLVEIGRNHVTAIEIDPPSVAILKEICDDVIQADLNDPAWPSLLDGRTFDAIVIADVLEHLMDPWGTLARASTRLRDGGSIVVSLPHASHAGVLACLMSNDFSYRDSGLLDRTHIRFFSIRNIQALFEGAGLVIVDHDYVIQPPENTELAGAWRMLPPLTRSVLEDNEFAHVYQVLVRAVRASDAPGVAGLRLPDLKPPEHPKRPRMPPEADLVARSLSMGLRAELEMTLRRILSRHPMLDRSARWVYRRVARSHA